MDKKKTKKNEAPCGGDCARQFTMRLADDDKCGGEGSSADGAAAFYTLHQRHARTHTQYINAARHTNIVFPFCTFFVPMLPFTLFINILLRPLSPLNIKAREREGKIFSAAPKWRIQQKYHSIHLHSSNPFLLHTSNFLFHLLYNICQEEI